MGKGKLVLQLHKCLYIEFAALCWHLQLRLLVETRGQDAAFEDEITSTPSLGVPGFLMSNWTSRGGAEGLKLCFAMRWIRGRWFVASR